MVWQAEYGVVGTAPTPLREKRQERARKERASMVSFALADTEYSSTNTSIFPFSKPFFLFINSTEHSINFEYEYDTGILNQWVSHNKARPLLFKMTHMLTIR